MAVQAGERLLHDVLGRVGVVHQQDGEADHAHPVVAVEVGQGARGRRHGGRRARVEGPELRQGLLHGATGVGAVPHVTGHGAIVSGSRYGILTGASPPKEGQTVPIATPEIYNEMLDKAKSGEFAYPAINVTGTESLNAALRGFAEAGSDGIVQVSTGGAEFLSGTRVKDMVTGASALAEFAHVVAAKYPVNIALHTDHCPKDKLDSYVRPLIAISQERVDRGENPLFQSHMWDGSATELHENLGIAAELLDLAVKAKIVLEIEIGVVGGEEDGVDNEINDKLYTSAGDYEATVEALGAGEKGRYLLAATFGNVHGVYKPGNVKLRPEILKQGQEVASSKLGLAAGSKPFDLVFHGGSGSLIEEIHEALGYGVVKMNVDTDTQYAFTRPIAAHMFTNYDGVLKVDGEVGNKKTYDPRSYLKAAELGMAERVTLACENLKSTGTSLGA